MKKETKAPIVKTRIRTICTVCQYKKGNHKCNIYSTAWELRTKYSFYPIWHVCSHQMKS